MGWKESAVVVDFPGL